MSPGADTPELQLRRSHAPELVISEVFSHGTAGGPQGADFVELHNFGTTSVDLGRHPRHRGRQPRFR